MPWLEISQAAFSLGLSERTLRNWIKSGKINAKTEGGVRYVEIPQEEYSSASSSASSSSSTSNSSASSQGQDNERIDDVYADGANAKFFDTQKRLEVALLECGRVKGTLTSQERIMETLSANISELSAKLQRAQNRTARWVVAATVLVALAVLAVFVRGSLAERSQAEQREAFNTQLKVKDSDIGKLTVENLTKENEYFAGTLKLKDEFSAKLAQAIKETQAAKDAERDRALRDLKADYKEMLDKNEKTIADLRSELDKKNAELLKLGNSILNAAEDSREMKPKAEDGESLQEKLDRLQKRYDELDAEASRLRRGGK